MKVDKINLDGKKSSIEVLDKIFSAKINKKLVNTVLYKTNANYKGRHAKTKQQNEVSGPTSKIYAQKGTGGARHASRKAPIFVGGGIAHGPKGEGNYKIRDLNKQLEWELPEDGSKTINGMIVDYLEYIPSTNLCMEINGYQLEILNIVENSIDKVKLKKGA